jgi:hypothetical protein
MSDQPPPIDQDLRAQLARRSAGRLPEGLATQVLQAVDVAPARPRYAWRAFSPRSERAAPRTLLAGASLAAAVLLVAALVVVPRSQMTPAASGLAGYPADRTLSSPELALLMSGPALPTNTALVANAVIDIRSDVCPMDRYGTVGIVEEMASQICVVTASDVLIQPFTIRGIFAFRYLGPGVLGLIGEITQASSTKTPFRVADEWPLQGKTFLVDGWLGAEGLLESCARAPTSGDVLLPNAEDCPYDNWLSDDSTAPGIQADHEYSAPSPLPSYDPLALRGNARHVEAGGMRLIDSLDPAAPVHGVYVVRSMTEGCPGDPPQSSRGCGAWRVLAKVAETSVPAPSGTPLEVATAAPTTAPPATPLAASLTGVIGTGNQPLNADELRILMVSPPDNLAGRIAIVEAPIPTLISCHYDANGGGGCAYNMTPLAEDGVWAVSVGADGSLSLIGRMSTPTAEGYVFTLDQVQAKSGGTGFVIVDAWLDWENGCDAPPVPYGSGGCGTSMLTAEKLSWMHMAALLPPGAVVTWVQTDAYRAFGSQELSEGVPGLYLVELADQTAPRILARLEAVTP